MDVDTGERLKDSLDGKPVAHPHPIRYTPAAPAPLEAGVLARAVVRCQRATPGAAVL